LSEVNSHCQAIFARMTDFFLHQKLGNRYVVSLEGAGKRTLKRSDLLGKNHGFYPLPTGVLNMALPAIPAQKTRLPSFSGRSRVAD
jgi:hypothetical protein